MREKKKRKKKKIIIAICIITGLFITLYFVLVNFLVSAALVPSFMRKLEAFERITDESYEAQVQTSD
ncbi:MAG: alpha/beta hydrolase, partial [Lachnospiraceae bacterium]|nr:alpha/beta hydrolase [Lachnospiraceae bacterium]